MNKKIFLGIVLGLATIVGLASTPVGADTTVYVSNLQPDYGAIGGGGVYSAYYGPGNGYLPVSPGSTSIYDGLGAGIIKAGFNTAPADDEGLFAFKPNITINDFAVGTLTYDVNTQFGVNPVWMTIEIDTGVLDVRSDNTTYQFVPTTNPAGWHTVNAGAGQWQKWNNNQGDVTGNPLISLSDVSTAHTALNVVRTYLRLGMGESYYNGGTGTTAWVDKTTLGGVTYDFVVYGAPSVPVIETPANGATITASAFDKVNWSDSTGGTYPPFEYQYEAYSDAGYTNLLYSSSWLTNSEIPTLGTAPGDYYLTVRARDAILTETAWSNGSTNVYKITVTPDPLNPFDVPAQCDQNIVYNLIEGTDGSNNINGTNGSDLILAMGGSDKVDGKGGADCIVGDAGADKLIGGTGNDVILGGDGSDTLQGDNGEDKLYGEGGSDSLKGGNQNDTLWGGDGSDTLKGEAGADMLDGGAGSDSANGGNGTADTCTAETEKECEI